MPRRTPVKEIQKEEVAVSSPLRRSSRISNISTVPTKITTRRSSASEAPTTTPKVTRGRRSSLSQESEVNDKESESKTTSVRTRRGSFSSNAAEEEVTTKRTTRASSVTKEQPADVKKPATRSRRSMSQEVEGGQDTPIKTTKSLSSSATKKNEKLEFEEAVNEEKQDSSEVSTVMKKSMSLENVNQTLEAIEEKSEESDSSTGDSSLAPKKKKVDNLKIDLDLSVIKETSLVEEDLEAKEEGEDKDDCSEQLENSKEAELKIAETINDENVTEKKTEEEEEKLTSDETESATKYTPSPAKQQEETANSSKSEISTGPENNVSLSENTLNLQLNSSTLDSASKKKNEEVISPQGNKENVHPEKVEFECEPMDVDEEDVDMPSPNKFNQVVSPSDIKISKMSEVSHELKIAEDVTNEIDRFLKEDVKYPTSHVKRISLSLKRSPKISNKSSNESEDEAIQNKELVEESSKEPEAEPQKETAEEPNILEDEEDMEESFKLELTETPPLDKSKFDFQGNESVATEEKSGGAEVKSSSVSEINETFVVEEGNCPDVVSKDTEVATDSNQSDIELNHVKPSDSSKIMQIIPEENSEVVEDAVSTENAEGKKEDSAETPSKNAVSTENAESIREDSVETPSKSVLEEDVNDTQLLEELSETTENEGSNLIKEPTEPPSEEVVIETVEEHSIEEISTANTSPEKEKHVQKVPESDSEVDVETVFENETQKILSSSRCEISKEVKSTDEDVVAETSVTLTVDVQEERETSTENPESPTSKSAQVNVIIKSDIVIKNADSQQPSVDDDEDLKEDITKSAAEENEADSVESQDEESKAMVVNQTAKSPQKKITTKSQIVLDCTYSDSSEEETEIKAPIEKKSIESKYDIVSSVKEAVKQADMLNSFEDVVVVSDNEEEEEDEEKPEKQEEIVDVVKEEMNEAEQNKSVTVSTSEDSPTRKHRKRHSIDKTSVAMQRTIKASDANEKSLTSEIHKVVDLFCDKIKKNGDVSINVSLEYTGNFSDSDKEVSLKENAIEALSTEAKVDEESVSANPKGSKRRKLYHHEDPVVVMSNSDGKQKNKENKKGQAETPVQKKKKTKKSASFKEDIFTTSSPQVSQEISPKRKNEDVKSPMKKQRSYKDTPYKTLKKNKQSVDDTEDNKVKEFKKYFSQASEDESDLSSEVFGEIEESFRIKSPLVDSSNNVICKMNSGSSTDKSISYLSDNILSKSSKRASSDEEKPTCSKKSKKQKGSKVKETEGLKKKSKEGKKKKTVDKVLEKPVETLKVPKLGSTKQKKSTKLSYFKPCAAMTSCEWDVKKFS